MCVLLSSLDAPGSLPPASSPSSPPRQQQPRLFVVVTCREYTQIYIFGAPGFLFERLRL